MILESENWEVANIKLPSLNMLPTFSTGDHNNEFRYFATNHPLVELRHDLVDIGFDLVVRSDWFSYQRMSSRLTLTNFTEHVEAVFLDAAGVHSA